MFCQTCGAENTEKARFCNMCGIPIAEPGTPGGPLPAATKSVPEDASDTVAMPMAPLQAQVVSTMAQQAMVDPSTSMPQTEAVTARPAPKNHDIGKTSHGVGIEPLKPAKTEEPAPSPELAEPEAPKSAAEPLHRKEETWEKRAAAETSPFDTSTSVSLKGIGLPSSKQRMAMVFGVGLVLMGLGALFMYLAMKPGEPEDAAVQTDPSQNEDRPEMVLGMPVPADGVLPEESSENGGENEASPRSNPGAQKEKTNSAQASDKPKNASSIPKSPASGTKNTVSRKNKSAAKAQSEKASTSKPGNTSETKPPIADETPEPKTDPAPAEAPEERNLEMEMYSSRVRYAVSRYYAARAQSCFDSITKNEPNLRGTVQVAFTIAQTGQVTGSRVTRNSTGHAGLGKCLVSQANSWRLPPPPEPNIELQMPFSR